VRTASGSRFFGAASARRAGLAAWTCFFSLPARARLPGRLSFFFNGNLSASARVLLRQQIAFRAPLD
jgi:hypothetical protein